MIFILFFSIIFYVGYVQPVLDGLVTPIYLENRYTFTNFEFARGHVYFKKGFDLPTNGTVVLNILDPVSDTIQANKSTIILQGDLLMGEGSSIKGRCFLRLGNNVLQFNSDQTLSSSDILLITSNGELRGRRTTIIKPSLGGIIFCGGVSIATLSNIVLDGPTDKNFICLTNSSQELILNNMALILKESLHVNASNITIRNMNMITGNKDLSLTCSVLLRFEKFADLIVSSGITLRTCRMGSIEATAGLILDNASLAYYSTPTSLFVFGQFSNGRRSDAGKITFSGPSSIIADPSTQLYLSKDSYLEMATAGRCELSPGTRLRIY